ncbi:DUF397 domain-containing protein [Streptomyces ossamyceticus]|uniref:DUF397 domain-containing protein n=1 Tax=Streptomyces ossamyceticus TaxID=249581 RepID=UPI003B8A8B59
MRSGRTPCRPANQLQLQRHQRRRLHGISPVIPGVAPVRDRKNPDGPVLVINRSAWQHFLDAVPTFAWYERTTCALVRNNCPSCHGN